MRRKPTVEQLLFGALYVEFVGHDARDLPSRLHNQGIRLYSVWVRNDVCQCGIHLRDFAKVYATCRHHRIKIRFIEKIGLPFWWRKVKQRKLLAGGVLLFIAILYGLSSIIWQVNITGVDPEDQVAIREVLSENGLHQGVWKSAVPQIDVLQSQILRQLPSLMWVGIQMNGSKVTVEAVKKIEGPKVLATTPHNIVAGKPGVIRLVLATRGQVLVHAGQVVRPGQVIISGDLGQGVRQVPAEGQVMAEVWYTSKVELPLVTNRAELTGNVVQREYLSVGNLRIRVWGWQQPKYKYTLERQNQTEWHIGSFELPIQAQNVAVYEVSSHVLKQSLTLAEKKALLLALQDVERQMGEGGTVLGQTVLQREVTHGKLYETIVSRTEEDIGTAVPLPVAHDTSGSQP